MLSVNGTTRRSTAVLNIRIRSLPSGVGPRCTSSSCVYLLNVTSLQVERKYSSVPYWWKYHTPYQEPPDQTQTWLCSFLSRSQVSEKSLTKVNRCLYFLCIFTGPPRQLQPVEGYKKSKTGRTVKLVCPVHGNPVPLTMWTKDGESINDGWERFRVRPTGLKIKDVVVEDSGHYVCRATNGFGSVSINYTLTVIGKYRVRDFRVWAEAGT